MKDKVTCSIIEDILPNYLEGVTGEETNKEIKEHLNGCESCRKTLEALSSDIIIDTPPQKEIRSFKKIKRVGIILLLVSFVIGIIVGVIAIIVGVIGIVAAEKNMDEALFTLAIICFAFIMILFRYIFPIIGIVASVIWIKKSRSFTRLVPIILLVFYSLWFLYAIGR